MCVVALQCCVQTFLRPSHLQLYGDVRFSQFAPCSSPSHWTGQAVDYIIQSQSKRNRRSATVLRAIT